MATKSSASELTRLINQLRQERQRHLDSLAEIDQTLKSFGISLASDAAEKGPRKGKPRGAAKAPAARGRKPGRKKGVKGKRGRKAATPGAAAGKASKAGRARKFPQTGDELIVDFIKDKGGASTDEIRKHWQASGRRGKAENYLTNLVRSGKLTRTKLAGKAGSIYALPTSSAS